VGGTTQDLLLRVIQDADLAGNSYWVLTDGEMVRLRPDWVWVVMEPRIVNGGHAGWMKYGYLYWEGGKGSGSDPVPFLPDEVMHYAPNPDPLAPYRGMSWLTPVLREIANDKAMNIHKSMFLENAATPNLSVALDKDVSAEAFEVFKQHLDLSHRGVANAYKTLYLGGGADVKVIGADFKQMDFATVQGRGETRIAAASGVPPIIVGLSEGLASSTYSNYSLARRRFADGTMHPLWQNFAGSVSHLLKRPNNSGSGFRLWFDTRDVPFLREDRKDAAEIRAQQAATISSLISAGFTPESAVNAVEAEDWDLLVHSGLVSVQLQPPGTSLSNSTSSPQFNGKLAKQLTPTEL
jgi:phage portal protein BeeE